MSGPAVRPGDERLAWRVENAWTTTIEDRRREVRDGTVDRSQRADERLHRSTSARLGYVQNSPKRAFIVAPEAGILPQMNKAASDKELSSPRRRPATRARATSARSCGSTRWTSSAWHCAGRGRAS